MIKPISSIRYSNVIIHKQLNWRCHSHHSESKIADPLSLLLRFLSRSASQPNDKIMLNIYKAIARNQYSSQKKTKLGHPCSFKLTYIYIIGIYPQTNQYALTPLKLVITKSKSNSEHTTHCYHLHIQV